jgi:hypothetical protein
MRLGGELQNTIDGRTTETECEQTTSLVGIRERRADWSGKIRVVPVKTGCWLIAGQSLFRVRQNTLAGRRRGSGSKVTRLQVV